MAADVGCVYRTVLGRESTRSGVANALGGVSMATACAAGTSAGAPDAATGGPSSASVVLCR